MLRNPIASFSIKQRRAALFILVVLNLVIIVVMQVMGQSLKPYGIIPFEFAGSVDVAQKMIADWTDRGAMNTLSFLLGFDYLFMITYSSFLWLACFHIADGVLNKFSFGFIMLAWLQPVAAILDATENFALYQIANKSLENVWPMLAIICAIPKFAITGLGFIVWLGGSVMSLLNLSRR